MIRMLCEECWPVKLNVFNLEMVRATVLWKVHKLDMKCLFTTLELNSFQSEDAYNVLIFFQSEDAKFKEPVFLNISVCVIKVPHAVMFCKIWHMPASK